MIHYSLLKPGFYWARLQAIDLDGLENTYETEENSWCIVEVTGVSPFLRGEVVYAGDGILPPVTTIYSPEEWEWEVRIPAPKTMRKKNHRYEQKRLLVRR